MTTDGLALVEHAEGVLKPLEEARNAAWWDANVQAGDDTERRRAETELAYSNALADGSLFEEIVGARRSDGHDPMVARCLDLLHDLMLRHQLPDSLRSRIVELEAAVETRYARHRGVVRGAEVGDNEIKRILRESDDPTERREAWEASKTVGAAVAEDVRELARLRNEAARALGHRDWFALSLATDEMDEQRLLETLDACDRATAEPFARWKARLDARLAERFGCTESELRPWHYADPFFQEPPTEGSVDLDPLFEGEDVVCARARHVRAARARGRRDSRAERPVSPPGKNQHAFCIDVTRGGDVRVLANVVANHSWTETMLHELGHGVYDLGLDRELPWLLRSTHLVTTEATALLFGALPRDREWLERVRGVDAGDVESLAPRLQAAGAAEHLVFTRWVLVMTGFERVLYADPDGDLDSAWWELVSRYQLVTPPDGRRAPDWAAKIHIAVAPVYYHTYLYGSIVAMQLREALTSGAGGLVDRPDAARLLATRLFAPGQSVRWDRLVADASGRPLSVASLAREVQAAATA